jgi:hypothetical protein
MNPLYALNFMRAEYIYPQYMLSKYLKNDCLNEYQRLFPPSHSVIVSSTTKNKLFYIWYFQDHMDLGEKVNTTQPCGVWGKETFSYIRFGNRALVNDQWLDYWC